MMSRFLLPVLSFFVAYGSLADTATKDAVVSFYGFEIERITGIHEEKIDELGCTFSAGSDAIASTLTEVDSSDVTYDRRDVRAKIEMHGIPYFVDRAGIVRQRDDYFRLDKVRFIASLTPVGQCESESTAAPEAEGRICIASVEAPTDAPKSLSNPAGGNPDVAYSVKITEYSPIAISRESGTWLDGLKVGTKLPVIIYENGERTASFYVQFNDDDSAKCLFMNTLYGTWQVWNWDRVGAWCDCDSAENE